MCLRLATAFELEVYFEKFKPRFAPPYHCLLALFNAQCAPSGRGWRKIS
jgi:hypothetical protein